MIEIHCNSICFNGKLAYVSIKKCWITKRSW